MSAGKHSLVHF